MVASGKSPPTMSRTRRDRPWTAYTHSVNFAEHEELSLARVVFDGMDAIQEQWIFDSDDHRIMLRFLITLDANQQEKLERVMQQRGKNAADPFFPVRLAGVTSEQVRMRFGLCLWQRLDDGAVRNLIRLVGEGGDDAPSLFGDVIDSLVGAMFEPQLSRTIEQAAITKVRLDALMDELQRAGVLDTVPIDRVRGTSIDSLPFTAHRELDRARDVTKFLD